MERRRELAELVDRVMIEQTRTYLATVPYARHLTDRSQPLHEAYYLRHRVETVRRIRETSRTDALALASLVREDYEASRPWARYLAEELSHDQLYLADLARHGVDAEAALGTPPFDATRRLIAFLENGVTAYGALPVVSYSVFVEWSSARYSTQVVEHAEEKFGHSHVRGSKAHTGIDDREDHYGMMLDIVARLVTTPEREALFVTLLQQIGELLRDYFTELHDATVLADEPVATPA